MNPHTRLLRLLALAGHVTLLGTLIVHYAWPAPPTQGAAAVGALLVIAPLVLPLRGLLAGRVYTHAWTSFLALPYFVLGIDAAATGNTPGGLALGIILASLTLFTGAVGYARLRGRELRAEAGGHT